MDQPYIDDQLFYRDYKDNTESYHNSIKINSSTCEEDSYAMQYNLDSEKFKRKFEDKCLIKSDCEVYYKKHYVPSLSLPPSPSNDNNGGSVFDYLNAEDNYNIDRSIDDDDDDDYIGGDGEDDNNNGDDDGRDSDDDEDGDDDGDITPDDTDEYIKDNDIIKASIDKIAKEFIKDPEFKPEMFDKKKETNKEERNKFINENIVKVIQLVDLQNKLKAKCIKCKKVVLQEEVFRLIHDRNPICEACLIKMNIDCRLIKDFNEKPNHEYSMECHHCHAAKLFWREIKIYYENKDEKIINKISFRQCNTCCIKKRIKDKRNKMI